ncbi:MAG: GntR family transcriptional regulator [Lentisphaeria bacterium]|nr:GntR family transcriptional regulator [Lentisphaeria bacterium]
MKKKNKTDQILNILRDELRSGLYEDGTRFPSEHKLMTRFGAARTTINKVTSLLSSEGFIRRGVRGSGTRVLNSSPFPRGLVAYLGPVSHPYYARMIQGIQLSAALKENAVCVMSPMENLHSLVLEKIRRPPFCGLLAVSIGLVPDSFPLPVVYLDNGYEPKGQGRGSVTCSNGTGAAEAAERVIALGHREILVCSNYSELEESRKERVRGFLDTMRKHGIRQVEKRFFHEVVRHPTGAKNLLREALAQFPKTTAILTDSDDLAYTLYYAARDLKLDGRICFTGFGNMAYSSDSQALPSVEQHPEEIGDRGFNELFRMITEPGYVPSRRIEVESEIVRFDRIPPVR